ncbi:flagellar hook-basal body complex protein FliE [Albimonas sp. CAU 1670]|uniref:flagellar hook-basal body complex protein FliE n=1 Tax=Albimonas sp. CAU 1670 TaxID=3032599 RepID=UPI0023D993D9|nr:flagellar hook-basal body complex protein FliE [Albimonas sp. CAU 1670]MDF2233509.1 flagellar hook-basal body complex protein FliE [Albimonas sp. CAU 1670]
MPAADSLAARMYQGLAPAIGAPSPQTRSPGEALAAAAGGFAQALREGETTAVRGLAGQADMQSVVTALSSAEIAVQTAVTVRDKVVEAYQEILRMPV